jgi:hypothetical protein
MLSPSAAGPSVHYAIRIGNGTCRVNGTVVLIPMGLTRVKLLQNAEGRKDPVIEFSYNAERRGCLDSLGMLDTFATDSVALRIAFVPA